MGRLHSHPVVSEFAVRSLAIPSARYRVATPPLPMLLPQKRFILSNRLGCSGAQPVVLSYPLACSVAYRQLFGPHKPVNTLLNTVNTLLS